MLIDWFTVGAQALNFLVLMWLLRRFLYQPILTAIDARETRIAAALADAELQKAGAKKLRDEFTQKNEQFATQRTALLARAVLDADLEGARMMDEVRRAGAALELQQRQALTDDAAQRAAQLRGMTVNAVFETARRALADLASVDVEARLASAFAARLRALPPDAKAAFGAALAAAACTADVRSRFALADADRATLQTAVNDVFTADVILRFDINPGGICGIELSAGGRRLAWSVDEYLTALEAKALEVRVPAAVPRAEAA
jgi:F-type H+-transporting ATPase subunit b